MPPKISAPAKKRSPKLKPKSKPSTSATTLPRKSSLPTSNPTTSAAISPQQKAPSRNAPLTPRAGAANPLTPPGASASLAKASWFTSPQTMVTFIVDKEEVKQTFMVHKDLATFHSPFFKAAFESHLLEGQTQVMRLDDVEAKTFGLLNGWLYTQNIDDETLKGPESLVPLAKLWLLARRCLIPNLQKALYPIIHSILRDKVWTLAQVKGFVVYAFEATDSQVLQRAAIFAIKSALSRDDLPADLFRTSEDIPYRAWFQVAIQSAKACLRSGFCLEYFQDRYWVDAEIRREDQDEEMRAEKLDGENAVENTPDIVPKNKAGHAEENAAKIETENMTENMKDDATKNAVQSTPECTAESGRESRSI